MKGVEGWRRGRGARPLKSASKGSEPPSRPLRRSYRTNGVKTVLSPAASSQLADPPRPGDRGRAPQHSFQGPPRSGPLPPHRPTSSPTRAPAPSPRPRGLAARDPAALSHVPVAALHGQPLALSRRLPHETVTSTVAARPTSGPCPSRQTRPSTHALLLPQTRRAPPERPRGPPTPLRVETGRGAGSRSEAKRGLRGRPGHVPAQSRSPLLLHSLAWPPRPPSRRHSPRSIQSPPLKRCSEYRAPSTAYRAPSTACARRQQLRSLGSARTRRADAAPVVLPVPTRSPPNTRLCSCAADVVLHAETRMASRTQWSSTAH